MFLAFESSKLGVLDFTNKFDLKAEIDKSSQKIKEIFDHASLTYDGEENLAKVNTYIT